MASNRIKGLTVEIGGDTTKLGKALEDVNEKGRDLSSELGEINKLLKFNPKNTELIAQKQKVLADIISNTSDKLETLKKAEAQVQKQFERGEVSEQQVRALQREIVETESKLKNYEKAAKSATQGTEELGDSAEKMGAKFAAAAKVGIGAVVTGATAAVGALVASAEATREYRTEMGKLDTAFTSAGHSSEAATATYKALQGVLGETDRAVEAANHLAVLTDNEQDLQKWTEICTGVYTTFGASLPIEGLTEAANETAKVGKVTGPLADALNWAGVSEDAFNESLAACTTEQERQTLIMETLNGLYSEAGAKYRETNAEIIRSNEANEAWTATLAEAGAAVEPILTDVKLLGTSLLADLMPGIVGVTEAFGALVNGEEGSAEAVGTALSALLTQIVNAAVEMLPSLIETATTLLTTLTTTLIEMLPELVDTGILLILSILDGLTQSIPMLTQAIVDTIPQLVESLVAGIPQILEGAIALFMALVDAIPAILPPLIQALPRIIDTIVDGLLDSIPIIVDGAIQLFFGILDAIPVICAELIDSAPSIVRSIADGLMASIGQLLQAGDDLMQGLIDGMLDFDIFGKVGKIGGKIVAAFKDVFDIHSPSRVMMGIGELLDEGLAEGIEDNATAPVNALDKLSEDMIEGTDGLNGLDLERRMVHSFDSSGVSNPAAGISNKLDLIYKAILSGQVIMLDGKTLVGSTADRYDTELGQRRVLAERGAI